MKKFSIIKNRWLIITTSLVLVVLASIPLLKTNTNSDLESYLPKSMPSRINNAKIQEIFGKSDPIIILFESDDVLNDSTLRRIRSLSKAFNRLKAFDMVMSLFDAKNMKGENGSMVVNPVVKRIPKSAKRKERLREEIKSNELVYKLIISENFCYTTIILNSTGNATDDELIATVNALLAEYPGNEKVTIFGQPYLRDEANKKVAKDFMILLPIGLLLMFLFLMGFFRYLETFNTISFTVISGWFALNS